MWTSITEKEKSKRQKIVFDGPGIGIKTFINSPQATAKAT